MEWPRTITIGGLPGTGTTTACRTLSERSGLKWVYVGEIFRQMAAEHQMSLAEFGAYAEQHHDVDRELDARQVQLLQGPPILIEGRLSGFFAYRDRVPAFKVWFTCDPHVRARRIVGREGGEVDERMAEMRRREESERKRYMAIYGYDPHDLSVYDLVLDTSELSKDAVVGSIEGAYRRSTKKRPWWRFGL